MFIDINEIGPKGVEFETSVDPSIRDPGGRDGLRLVSADIRGSVRRGDRGADLAARLLARVELQCSRCAEPFTTNLVVDVRLTIVGESVEFGEGEMEIAKDDASLFPSTSGKVDLAAVAAEQIYLDLPLKPVCGAECLGLCPTCGANRNQIECGCRIEETDPRLAPLAEIRNGFRGPGSD